MLVVNSPKHGAFHIKMDCDDFERFGGYTWSAMKRDTAEGDNVI